MFDLRFATPIAWTKPVLADFDRFLQDHAAAEKKASGMAVSMFSHYPDKPVLVEAMVNLALEEMNHFRQVAGTPGPLHGHSGFQSGLQSRRDFAGICRYFKKSQRRV